MAQGTEEPPVADREFPVRAHYSKLGSHEQNNDTTEPLAKFPIRGMLLVAKSTLW
jgi:hypothetical protein